MIKQLLTLIALASISNAGLWAAEGAIPTQVVSRWEFNAGIGLSITANGLPSQVSNALAIYDNYVGNVGDMKGLPMGGSGFANFGYRFDNLTVVGLEYAMGLNADGGRAKVSMGSVLPGYVWEGIDDASKVTFENADGSTQDMAISMYNGLSTYNTMKGMYLDPRLRVFWKLRRPVWNFQLGTGMAVIIPINYYAYPSKDSADYNRLIPGWGEAIAQQSIKGVPIPFPLVTRDGKVYMNAVQPLFDVNARLNLSRYFLDVDYATEFNHIHNLKISLGIQYSSWHGEDVPEEGEVTTGTF